MKKIVVSLFVIVAASCHNGSHETLKSKPENSYTVKGKIDGMDTGRVLLGMYDTTNQSPLIIFDSAKLNGSYFEFHGKLATPLICKLMIKNLAQGWPYTHLFVLDTGITNVHLYKDSMANSVITGTPLQDDLNAFNKKLRDIEITFEKNYSLNKKGVVSDDSLNKLETAFYKHKHDLILQQIRLNPTAITSGFNSRLILPNADVSTLEEFCNALGQANNYFTRHLATILAAKKKTGLDMQAPSFTIIDKKNRTFTNDSFKGEYLLLDFWASWCVPCREENPNVVKAYHKYANKEIEFVSMSSDDDRKKWEKAIKKDRLTWIQACKFDGSNSKVNKDFDVILIPSNFLIDKEGKIVAKNLTGKELEKVLGQRLGN